MSIFGDLDLPGGEEESSPQGVEPVAGDASPELFTSHDDQAATTKPVDPKGDDANDQGKDAPAPKVKKDRTLIILLAILVLVGGCAGYLIIRTVGPALRNRAVVNTPVPAVSQATPTVAVPQGNPTAIIPTAVPTAIPTAIPTKVPAFVWDSTFRGLATYYVDGDPLIENFKEKGKPMKYVCGQSYGVFVTMDPGFVQGVKTTHEGKDYGAAAYVPCQKGEEITLSTVHWSESALHQQVHLVELKGPLPTGVDIEQALRQLMVDDGKPLAYLFSTDGTFKLILGDQLK